MRKPRNIACRNLKVLNKLINTSEPQITEIQTFKNLITFNLTSIIPISNNTSIVEFEVYAFDVVNEEYHIIKGNVKNLSATLNISIYDTYISDSDIINSYSITKNNNNLNFDFNSEADDRSFGYISLQNASTNSGGYSRNFTFDPVGGNLTFIKYDQLSVIANDENGLRLQPLVFEVPIFDFQLYSGLTFEFIDNTTGVRWFIAYSKYVYPFPQPNTYLTFEGFLGAFKNYGQPNQTEETLSAVNDVFRAMNSSSKVSFEFINFILRKQNIINYYLKTKSYNI